MNSKAYYAGFEDRDVLMAVNGRDIGLATHAGAMRLIEEAGENLDVTVIRSALLQYKSQNHQ